MKFVGVLEAKTHLSRLLDELEETGEPLVITRHGKPVATIYGAQAPGAARGVSDGDRQAVFEGEAGAKRPEPRPRRKSAAELSEMFRKLREEQPRDPEIAAMSWEEFKELGRS
jgi:prevent-host-death family protein